MYLIVPSLILGITLPSQEIYMQNYLSIGVDALVTYNFHKARESPFYVMSSRLINKFIYFSYGTKDVLERECRNLNKVHAVQHNNDNILQPVLLENASVYEFESIAKQSRQWL